jgi:hypothetical protein
MTGITHAYAQPFTIANRLNNIVYAGIPNYLNVAVSGCPCEAIFLTADSGRIEPQTGDSPCQFILTPHKPGHIRVTVHAVSRKDTMEIGSVVFLSNRPPEPTVLIGGANGGYIRKAMLIPQLGPVAAVRGLECSPRYVINKFTVALLRDEKIIFFQTVSGVLFSAEMKEMFRNTQHGDILLVKDVSCIGVDSKTRQLLPVVFSIQD